MRYTLQPVHLAEARKVAEWVGGDVIVFTYITRTRMKVNGVSRSVSYQQWGIQTPEDFEWWARNFEITSSAVVSPPSREG